MVQTPAVVEPPEQHGGQRERLRLLLLLTAGDAAVPLFIAGPPDR